MKTRIIRTCFWVDDKTQLLGKEAKLLFIYLLTCERIGLTGTFPIPDSHILGDTSLTSGKFLKAKQELEATRRVLFHNGWVRVVNAEKHNPYKNSPKNEGPYNEEISLIPPEISGYFDGVLKVGSDTTIDSTSDTNSHSNHKSKTLNHKSKEEGVGETKDRSIKYLQEMSLEEKERLSKEFPGLDIDLEIRKALNWLESNGKSKKDYRHFFDNWLIEAKERQSKKGGMIRA